MVKTFLELEVDEHGQPLPEDKKENRSLFKNLNIAKEPRAMAELGAYPVIDLSLGGIKAETWAVCYRRIQDRMATLYDKYDFLLEKKYLKKEKRKFFERISDKTASLDDTMLSLRKLSDYLSSYYKKKVVILIDEYDTILTSAYSSKRPYYSGDALPFMQAFLTEALKDNLNLRLGYVTGIFRTAQASIFSLLNNLDVYTVLDKNFSHYFGFTKAEVDDLAIRYGAANKLDEIKKWYNGYNFGMIEIYNPWSILRYFSRNFEPKAYWMGTSDNSLVYDMMLNAHFYDSKNMINFFENGAINTKLYEAINYTDLAKSSVAIWTFLLSAGYLTPSGEPDEFKIYKLVPPNLEIKDCISELFVSKLTDTLGVHQKK
jgi:hypothetical protein